MADYIEQALQRPPANAPRWLDLFHQQGRRSCREKALPTGKTEDWKYTSLRALGQRDYAGQPAPVAASGDLT